MFSSRLVESYDKGTTRWYIPTLDERPKPEALIQLEEGEYWRKNGPEQRQIRPGYDVYIKPKILDSIAAYFGPQSKENCIKKYNFALLTHMVGGPEVAYKLWRGEFFGEGFRSMLVYDDLVAVCLHCDEVFHLLFSINPTGAMIVAGVKLQRKKKHTPNQNDRIAKGCRLRQPKNLVHYALNVT